MTGPLTRRILDTLPEVGPEEYDPLWDDLDQGWLGPSSPLHRDREGVPITMREWSRLWHCFAYRQVAWTEVGGYYVSTVWLGIDHAIGDTPLIFESMVFESELSHRPPSRFFKRGFWYHRSFEEQRYSTEEGAQAGHAKIVHELRTIIGAMPDPRDLPIE